MLLDIEVRRVVRILGIPDAKADSYLDKFYFEPIDDVVHRKALAIPFHLSGADSIHVATAERLGKDFITLVTHDAQMAAAARSLGMEVLDPVTDDPKRPPV
jgi:predicted nucleic acid-binding protein